MDRRNRQLHAVALAFTACAPGGPTYNEDVGPLVAEHCVSCHDGSADDRPDLSTVDALRDRIGDVLAETEAGTMPPGNLDRSGACGDFTGPGPLEESDVDLLARWWEDGMPEGPAERARQDEPQDFVADLTASLASTPASEHRCFLVDPGVDEPFSASAWRVTSTGSLHHVLLYTADSDAVVAGAMSLDAADEAAGWDCFAGTSVPGSTLAGVWTPGSSVVELPPGTAIAFPARPFLVQLHYGGEPIGEVETTFDFRTTDAAAPLSFVPFAIPEILLPPGDSEVTLSRQSRLAFPAGRLHGVLPHLHQLGRSLHLESANQCLADVPDWDYRWQDLGAYADPIDIPASLPLQISCTWDTTSATGLTMQGERASDEMCMSFLLVSP